MPTTQEMRDVITKYLDFYNAGDADRLNELFADSAVVEDPVGSAKIHRGRSEVQSFYQECLKHGTQLELKGPIRSSHGNAAALAIEVHAKAKSKPVNVAVIDVVTFDDQCRIESMKCYWGPDDVFYG